MAAPVSAEAPPEGTPSVPNPPTTTLATRMLAAPSATSRERIGMQRSFRGPVVRRRTVPPRARVAIEHCTTGVLGDWAIGRALERAPSRLARAPLDPFQERSRWGPMVKSAPITHL